MTNFIKFYHSIISSLIIFILVGFVPNEAQGFLGEWLMPSGNREAEREAERQEQRRQRTPIANEATLATEVRDVDREIRRKRRAINYTNENIRKLRQELIPIAREVQAVCGSNTGWSSNVTRVSGQSGMFCVQTKETENGNRFYTRVGLTEEKLNRYNEARRRQIEIERELRIERGALRILTERLEGLENRITDEVPVDARREPERQALTIETLGLQVKLSDLGDNLRDIDHVLDEVERLYDNTVLGAYMQDKIGQLLNSQVICAARKRCAVGDPRKIPPSQIRDELFPSTQTRESYYDHDRLQRIRRERGTAD